MVKPLAHRLRHDILTGRWAPGERLPPERTLAGRLGTNRNTLREALRTLESENLLRARQGDGTRVRDWRSDGEINLLPWFLSDDTPIPERLQSLTTLLELRDQLIDKAIQHACASGPGPELETIEEALRELEIAAAVIRPNVAPVAADVEVYRRLVLASHDLVLTWVFNTFARIFIDLGERFPQLWSIDTPYIDGLHRVLRHVREGREDRARAEMRKVFAERAVKLDEALRPGLITMPAVNTPTDERDGKPARPAAGEGKPRRRGGSAGAGATAPAGGARAKRART